MPLSFVLIKNRDGREVPAIIDATYSQQFGGKNIEDYSVYTLDESLNKITNRIAWIEESQITIVPHKDDLKALELIEEFNFSLEEDENDDSEEDDEED